MFWRSTQGDNVAHRSGQSEQLLISQYPISIYDWLPWHFPMVDCDKVFVHKAGDIIYMSQSYNFSLIIYQTVLFQPFTRYVTGLEF